MYGRTSLRNNTIKSCPCIDVKIDNRWWLDDNTDEDLSSYKSCLSITSSNIEQSETFSIDDKINSKSNDFIEDINSKSTNLNEFNKVNSESIDQIDENSTILNTQQTSIIVADNKNNYPPCKITSLIRKDLIQKNSSNDFDNKRSNSLINRQKIFKWSRLNSNKPRYFRPKLIDLSQNLSTIESSTELTSGNNSIKRRFAIYKEEATEEEESFEDKELIIEENQEVCPSNAVALYLLQLRHNREPKTLRQAIMHYRKRKKLSEF